ncbi:unnamed protein product [Boreogadus saida]
MRPVQAVKIVKACVALHNFLASTEQARYMPASFVDTTADTGEVQPGEWRQHVEGDRNMVDGPRRLMVSGRRVISLHGPILHWEVIAHTNANVVQYCIRSHHLHK